MPCPAVRSALISLDLPDDLVWRALPGGRTNPVWRARSNGLDIVVKQAGHGPQTPIFPNRADLEWAALVALAGMGIAPLPLHLVMRQDLTVLVYQHVGAADAPPKDRSPGPSPDAPMDALDVLARLHRTVPWPGLPRRALDADAIRADVARWAPGNAPPPPTLSNAMLPVPVVPPVPVHRDPVPANVVITKDGAVLIDWQCPALGDPCEDLAHLLSPMMRIVYGHPPLTADQRAAVIARYPDPRVQARFAAMAPLYHWRLACYGLWQTARGRADYAPGIALELALAAGSDQQG